jgi:hypothetical protein
MVPFKVDVLVLSVPVVVLVVADPVTRSGALYGVVMVCPFVVMVVVPTTTPVVVAVAPGFELHWPW